MSQSGVNYSLRDFRSNIIELSAITLLFFCSGNVKVHNPCLTSLAQKNVEAICKLSGWSYYVHKSI